MKKLALIAVASLMAGSFAFAQGTVNFNTRVVPDVVAQVFMPDGTTPIAGDGFTAQLFGGPAGTAEASLAPMTPTTVFRTGAGAGFVVAAGSAAVPGAPGGGSATLQLRVWENLGGTVTSYAQAASGGLLHGSSELFTVANLGDLTASPPTTPPNLIGLQSFSLIPEPSTYALLALGAAAFLFRRRKTA
jgi:hypothetical protein